METKKKKSNLLTGEDPESAINMKYCEAIRKQMESSNKENLYRDQSKRLISEQKKKKTAKK